MSLISIQARIIHLIQPFIQKALQMSAWDVEYNSFIIVYFIELIMNVFYSLPQFHHLPITQKNN